MIKVKALKAWEKKKALKQRKALKKDFEDKQHKKAFKKRLQPNNKQIEMKACLTFLSQAFKSF